MFFLCCTPRPRSVGALPLRGIVATLRPEHPGCGGREYYEYTDAADREQTIKKDFPFPESLMELLYMDTQELEAITRKTDKALLAFYQSSAKDDLQVVAAGLDELASRHVYFELLRLDWLERLDMVDSTAPGDFQDLLPHKKISHLCIRESRHCMNTVRNGRKAPKAARYKPEVLTTPLQSAYI